MPQETVYLGLGSNVGDRVGHVRAGLARLRDSGLRLLEVSSFYLTEPVLRSAAGRDDAAPGTTSTAGGETAAAGGEAAATPDASGRHRWYVNCVASFADAPAPRRLLALCLDIERGEGRERGREPSGNGAQPRTLDIDVLLIGDRVIDEPGLIVPHPRMSERRFVLEPLAEIAPDLRHPVTGASMRELRDDLPPRERVMPLQPQPGGVA